MNETEFQRLLNAEPPLLLIASKKKGVFLLLWSALFVTGGILFIQYASDIAAEAGWGNVTCFRLLGWANVVFFGLGILAGLTKIVFPENYSLTLDKRCFVVRTIFRKDIRMWKDVSGFVATSLNMEPLLKQINLISGLMGQFIPIVRGPSKMKGAKFIFFDDGSASKQAALNRSFTGYSCALIVDYDLTADQLAQLMNHWREKSLGSAVAVTAP
jgi:hypothetical protein